MQDIKNFVIQLVAQKTSTPACDGWWDLPLDELGLTSIDFAEILFEIEERFNIEVRLDRHAPAAQSSGGMPTLREVGDTLASTLASQPSLNPAPLPS